MDPMIEFLMELTSVNIERVIEGLSEGEIKIFDRGRAAGLTDASYIATHYMDELGVTEDSELGDKIVTLMERLGDRLELVAKGGVKGLK